MSADSDKWTRSEIAATMIRNGRVFFPLGAPWLDEWEHELTTFPNGTYDDQVDTLSYAAIVTDSRRQKPVKGLPTGSIRARMRQRRGGRVHPVLGKM